EIHAAELLERKCVVVVRFAVHDDLQLPPHQFGRTAIHRIETREVIARELRQASSGKLAAAARPLVRLRRQLPIEGLLFRALEESGIDGLVRVLAHPLCGESIEKLTDGRRLRGKHHGANQQGGCEREAFHEDSPGFANLVIWSSGHLVIWSLNAGPSISK